ncbi:MAG: hypothetical protein HC908_01930 [Calothrix sp. SM1_7_51]|nr:hypothetical protein [Calothrix sp. SM1_7_51]
MNVILMKKLYRALAGGLISLALIKVDSVQAATIVSPTFNRASPDGMSIGLCGTFFPNGCTPGATAVGTASGDGANLTILNDSNFTITGLTVKILTPDAEWGTVRSNIFPENGILVDEVRKKLELTGGKIPIGGAFSDQRVSNNGRSVELEISFAGVPTSVPEPSLVLALSGLAMGAASSP